MHRRGWLVRRVRRAGRGDAGFTLMEVMITVACIGILGAIAMPRFQAYVLEARLNGAKPYMMDVAGRVRMSVVETSPTLVDGVTEDGINTSFGINLAEAGDFCFMAIAVSSEFAYKTNAVASRDFEVWAVLRDASASNPPAAANGKSCTASTGKLPATGWVRAGTTTLPGRAGRAVVLHYPPPPNGPSADNSMAINFVWQDGFSVTNALVP